MQEQRAAHQAVLVSQDTVLQAHKLAQILLKLDVASGMDVDLETVWRTATPEVRNFYRDRAALVIYMLGEETK